MRCVGFQSDLFRSKSQKGCFATVFRVGVLAVLFLSVSAGFSQTAAVDSKEKDAPSVENSKAQTPRQKELADDTARLLVLANELKVELDKSSKDTLSLSVIKKADEVEKLARKVKDEIKKSLGN